MTRGLPDLTLEDWRLTRDTLHRVVRMAGALRRHYMPAQKHWWHITLTVSARGLTTTPFPAGDLNVEITLDLLTHRLLIEGSGGHQIALPLQAQTEAGLRGQIESGFRIMGLELESDLLSAFDCEETLSYDVSAAGQYFRAMGWIDAVFRRFKGGLREETGPVHLFPHHMDLSMNWFSGRRVPGIDPADAENADEQLNFGFVTGDESIPDAYFYVTAYPVPDGWADLELPAGAHWHTEGWTGAVLPYAAVAASDRPAELLLGFQQALLDHARRLMG